jgi:hypothetical protein
MKINKSPFRNIPKDKWKKVTNRLVKKHPLDIAEIVEVVLSSWESIFHSKLGTKGFKIGKRIFPQPQVMGFLLHELIPLEFAARHKTKWKRGGLDDEKDLVYIPNKKYSVEIKTSSNKAHIFGNRSYAQETAASKKSKSGYYLAVNFEKFTTDNINPKVTLIRFGWLDHSDWLGQKAASGQQARLDPFVEDSKFLELYRA